MKNNQIKKVENVLSQWLGVLDEMEEVRQRCAENHTMFTQNEVLAECIRIADSALLPMQSVISYIEEVKQKVENKPLAYPKDYLLRLVEAEVAQQAGFENRTVWTDMLKQIPGSKYFGRYSGVCGTFYY